MTRKQLLNLLIFLILLAIEVLIALFIHDSFIRPYFGDILVFIPEKYPWLPAVVFAFAVAIEFMQHLRLAERLGITNPILRTILGSVYDTTDILCYGIGCVFLAVYEWVRRKGNR